MDLSQRLKQARKHAKLTQRALADAVRVQQPVISQLENGQSLKSAYITSIARVCGVNPLWLAEGIGEMLPNSERGGTNTTVAEATCRAEDVANLASPRSSAVLNQIATAAAEGRLTDDDLELLGVIADRLESRHGQPAPATNKPHNRLRERLKNAGDPVS